jgi:uncharacterized protein HemY
MSDERWKLEQLKELAQLEPDDPVVHYGLGCEHLRFKESDEAAACFRRALELEAGLFGGHRDLGKALEKLGRVRGHRRLPPRQRSRLPERRPPNRA